MEPWDAQLGETPKQFLAFTMFLRQGIKRSYENTAAEYGCHVSLINKWGSQNDWQNRARQYDAWVMAQQEERRIEKITTFQEQIIADESQDYRELRALWLSLVSEAKREGVTAREFISLMESRDKLSKLGRRRAALPSTYRQDMTEKPKAPDGPFVLKPNTPTLHIPDRVGRVESDDSTADYPDTETASVSAGD